MLLKWQNVKLNDTSDIQFMVLRIEIKVSALEVFNI